MLKRFSRSEVEDQGHSKVEQFFCVTRYLRIVNGRISLTLRRNRPIHHVSEVSTVTENAFVWLKIAAPSDLLLDVVRLINVLTYLLTYC